MVTGELNENFHTAVFFDTSDRENMKPAEVVSAIVSLAGFKENTEDALMEVPTGCPVFKISICVERVGTVHHSIIPPSI